MAKLCPLFSGSSGNSYYIGSEEEGILIDAGRSARQITKMLENCGIPITAVKGIFVTHEHTDHIKGVRVFASKNQVPVFASRGTLESMKESGNVTDSCISYVIDETGMDFAGMHIIPFPISHDCAQGYGYTIHTQDNRVITFSTDLGIITSDVENALFGSNMVILESNHDVGMLQNGSYPYFLKRRILSNIGHLSNEVCAQLLPNLAQNGTKQFLLAHLSKENNTPDLAYQTALCALTMCGLKPEEDFHLSIAPRENVDGKTISF